MNKDEFETVFNETVDILNRVLNRKRNDYATQDVLSNFKRNAKFAELLNIDMTRPEGYALFMVMMKLDRVCNLLFSEKEPANESISDSIVDMLGYAMLADAILKETQNE